MVENESPLDILDRRLARGEISPEDYRERRALLTTGRRLARESEWIPFACVDQLALTRTGLRNGDELISFSAVEYIFSLYDFSWPDGSAGLLIGLAGDRGCVKVAFDGYRVDKTARLWLIDRLLARKTQLHRLSNTLSRIQTEPVLLGLADSDKFGETIVYLDDFGSVRCGSCELSLMTAKAEHGLTITSAGEVCVGYKTKHGELGPLRFTVRANRDFSIPLMRWMSNGNQVRRNTNPVELAKLLQVS